MSDTNYLVKEAAEKLRTGENVIRNLIFDGRIKAMKMPTLIIADFELERFRREITETQEDLSKYADKKFAKKVNDKNKLLNFKKETV